MTSKRPAVLTHLATRRSTWSFPALNSPWSMASRLTSAAVSLSSSRWLS